MYNHNYIVNNSHSVMLNDELILSNSQVLSAIDTCNKGLKELYDAIGTYDINVFEALGLRNLSGFIGEVFVKNVERVSQTSLTKNPHQDGYPDLLLTNNFKRKSYFNSIVNIIDNKLYPKDKDLFSPFLYGGIEVKATCGNTPSASKVPKPLIGESRIELLKSFDWKAHHRETNNLLSILWDFIDGLPTIVACFYCNTLITDDWGEIVQPKSGGGRTTSVSIMRTAGVKKMCTHWLAIIDNNTYLEKLSNEKWIGSNPKK